jgi:small-conductance mechanosensitive channel
MELLVWVDEPVLRGLILHELNTAVFKSFRAEGVEIPYSKHDVFIKSMPGVQGDDEPPDG